VTARDSGIANFHHLPGRKLAPSFSNKPVLVMCIMGPIQIRGTGTRQLSVRLRFVLL
jgi:hypothetical protein